MLKLAFSRQSEIGMRWALITNQTRHQVLGTHGALAPFCQGCGKKA
jgi:hypothetical protein